MILTPNTLVMGGTNVPVGVTQIMIILSLTLGKMYHKT